MNLNLENKVAIVIASSKGLGFATAKKLAGEGAKVVLSSSSQQNINTAVSKIQSEITKPENVTGIVLDLSDSNKIPAFIDAVIEKFGQIDILITNSAPPASGLFDNLSSQDLQESYQSILLPTFSLIKHALPHLRESKAASVLTITSISVKQPVATLLMSNIYRPALVGLTKTLSQELGPENIRFNSILPGFIATNRTKELLEKRPQMDVISNIPLGRLGNPEEFANVATFLVSPAASYINGAMLQVDGGLYGGLL